MAGYIIFQNDKHAQNHFASIRIVNVNGMGE